jgi:hypothetical protein
MNERAVRAVVAHWRHIGVAAYGGAGVQHAGKAIADFANEVLNAIDGDVACVDACQVCNQRATPLDSRCNCGLSAKDAYDFGHPLSCGIYGFWKRRP